MTDGLTAAPHDCPAPTGTLSLQGESPSMQPLDFSPSFLGQWPRGIFRELS